MDDNSNNEELFFIERKTNSGSFQKIDSVTADGVSYSDRAGGGILRVQNLCGEPESKIGLFKHCNGSHYRTGPDRQSRLNFYPNPATELITVVSNDPTLPCGCPNTEFKWFNLSLANRWIWTSMEKASSR